MKKIKEKNLLLVGGLALVGLLLYKSISAKPDGNYTLLPGGGDGDNSGKGQNINVNDLVNTAVDFGKDVLDYARDQNQPTTTDGRALVVVYKMIRDSLQKQLEKAAANGGVYTWVDKDGVSRSKTADEIQREIAVVEEKIRSLSK